MGRFFRSLGEYAHELGAIYYLFGILSALGGVAYFIYKQLTTPAIEGLGEVFFAIFTISFIVASIILPFLILRIFRSANTSKLKLPNPAFVVEHRDVKYSISPTGLLKHQTLKLRALNRVSLYKIRIAITGQTASELKVKTRGVALLGPIQETSGDLYNLRFEKELESQQVTEIEYTIEVFDPDQTMRKFLSDNFGTSRATKRFSAKYTFSSRPQRVLQHIEAAGTGERIADIRELLPDSKTGCSFSVELDQPISQSSCVVSWVW